MIYVSTNYFHVADQSFYKNTSWCTDLIYHDDLNILWVLAWDSQTQGGLWSRCVYHILCILSQHHCLMCLLETFLLIDSVPVCTATIKPSVSNFTPDKASHWWVREEFALGTLAKIGYLPWRGLSFHPSFSSLIFLVFAYVLICLAFLLFLKNFQN